MLQKVLSRSIQHLVICPQNRDSDPAVHGIGVFYLKIESGRSSSEVRTKRSVKCGTVCWKYDISNEVAAYEIDWECASAYSRTGWVPSGLKESD